MKNKLNIIISVICFSLTIGLCTFLILHKDNKELTDALKFKKQFEAVNSLVNPFTNEKYIELHIDDDNPFVYKTGKEIVDILNNESAIIFMGYPESDLTRVFLPIFLDVLKENNLNKVYYLDILEIRDKYKYSGSIVPELVHEGTKAYYEIVEFLNDYLDRYYVNDPEGNRYDTAVKRINTPTIVTIKSKEVINYHFGIGNNHDEEHAALSEEEQASLKGTLTEIIKSYKEATEICSSNIAC